MNATKVFRISALILFICGFIITSKPVYFYARGHLIQHMLKEKWDGLKENKPLRYDFLNLIPKGRIMIPHIGLDNIVLDGADESTLSYGLGQVMNGTEIHEKRHNIVISGHRDSYFNKLKDIRVGDKIVIEHIEGKSEYVVDDIFLADPSEIEHIDKGKDKSLTLITCYPFNYVGAAPFRIIVVGKLVL